MESTTFENPAWKGELGEHFAQLLTDQAFCDIVLESGDLKISAHRIILASASPVIREMLFGEIIESKNGYMKIDGVESHALKELINYCYTGSVNVTSKNVQNLIKGSDFLQLIWVRDKCEMYLMQNVDFDEVLQQNEIAGQMSCDIFSEIAKSAEFLSWSCKKLLKILQSDFLCVEGEEEVYEACLKWINHDKEQREKHFEQIFKYIRISDLPLEYVSKYIDEEQMVWKSMKCVKKLVDFKNFHLFPSSRKFAPPRSYKQMLIVGKKPESEMLTFEVYDPFAEKWRDYEVNITDPLLQKWCNCKVVSWGDKICVISCGVGVAASNFWIHDVKNSTSICESDYLSNDYGFATCNIDEKLYFFGGTTRSGIYQSKIRYYCIKSGTWKYVGDVDKIFKYGQAVYMNGFVFITGGKTYGDCTSSRVEKYDINFHSCTSLNSGMQTPRAFHAACCLNGKIYVAGGNNSGGETLRSVEVYDPETNEWELVAEMNIERESFGLIPIMNKLWAIGGGSKFSRNSIEIYDPISDQWSFGPEMTKAMDFFGCGIVNGNIFHIFNKALMQ